MLDDDPQVLGLCDLDDGSSLCLRCNKKFRSPTHAKIHYKEIHCVDRSQKSFICPVCQKGFPIKRYMANHMRIMHGLSQKMIQNTYIPM